MRPILSWMIVGLAIGTLLFGCGPRNRMTRQEMIQQEASQITPPMKPLSHYAHFKLAKMEMSEAVSSNEKKINVAQSLENKLDARLSLLLNRWNSQEAMPGSYGTLIIQPVLQKLRIVSSGARFWVAGMAGDSRIEMDLVLVEEGSNQSICSARIQRSANGVRGGWSMGATDRALPDFIVELAYQYLADNYTVPK